MSLLRVFWHAGALRLPERAPGAPELVLVGALERVVEQLLFERGGQGFEVGGTLLPEGPGAEEPGRAFELRLGQRLRLRRGGEGGGRGIPPQDFRGLPA